MTSATSSAASSEPERLFDDTRSSLSCTSEEGRPSLPPRKSGLLAAIHSQVYEDIAVAPVKRIPTGQPLLGRELWDTEPALVFVVRRSGCPLCRTQALLISHSRAILQRLGYRIIAVLNEDDVDNSDFGAKYWSSRLILDEPLAFHCAVGGGKIRKGSIAASVVSPSFAKRVFRVMNKNKVSGTAKAGIGPILGGMLLMLPGDEGIAYMQGERTFGDFGDFAKVIQMAYLHSPRRHEIDQDEIEEAIEAHQDRLNKRLTKCDDPEFCPVDPY